MEEMVASDPSRQPFQKESLCLIIVIIVLLLITNQCFIPAPLYSLIFWKCPRVSKLQGKEKEWEQTSQSQTGFQYCLLY